MREMFKGGDIKKKKEMMVHKARFNILLERAATLHPKIQDDILEDLKKRNAEGALAPEFLDRMEKLINNGQNLDFLESIPGDDTYW